MPNSRDKGKRGELECLQCLRDHWGTGGIRSAQACGAYAADLLNVLDGVHVEVKRRKRIAALQFLRQAESDSDGEVPVVIMREDQDTEWVVMARVSDMPELARSLLTQSLPY